MKLWLSLVMDLVVYAALIYVLFEYVPTLISSPSDANVGLGIGLIWGFVAYACVKIRSLPIVDNTEEE